jgi:hypothetical protein
MAVAKKEWFLLVAGRKEGPYSFGDLRRDPRVTPDTLVWKKGRKGWVKAGKIPELRSLFEEEEADSEEERPDFPAAISPEGMVIGMEGQEPPFFLWTIVLAILFTYLLLKLFYS